MSEHVVVSPRIGRSTQNKPLRKAPNAIAYFTFGVVVPTVTLIVELVTHLCSENLFNPAPTLIHVALIGSVPVLNIYVWRGLQRQRTNQYSELALANGFAIGVSGFYALLFLPLVPIGLLLIPFWGIGFLILAPLGSFITGFLPYRHFRLMEKRKKPAWMRKTGVGMFVGFLFLVALELPVTVTRVAMQKAASENAATRTQGLRWLRAVGDEDLVLQACYRPLSFERDMVSFVLNLSSRRGVSTDEARTVYYLLTGNAFNSVPPPEAVRSRLGGWIDDWDWDQAGEGVGQWVRGLSMASSQLDGSVDADAALGYIEWTMEFQNVSETPREARAVVKLPPGGVVSRVTLWIDGEEREAAFGGRAQVRDAYEKVVRRQRDPLLVTTAGPDRVLVQCFPVPPNGALRIRLGITAPLDIQQPRQAIWLLPHLEERNFAIAGNLDHSVWIESKHPLKIDGVRTESDGKVFGVRGLHNDVDHTAALHIERSPRLHVWTPDPFDDDFLIRQTMRNVPIDVLDRVVFVIDGSASMEVHRAVIAQAFSELAGPSGWTVLVAEDPVEMLADAKEGTSIAEAASRIRRIRTVGGRDNVQALGMAWDLASEGRRGAVIWLHGPQPVKLSDPHTLIQRWQRCPDGPLLYEVALDPGPNAVLAALDTVQGVVSVPSIDALQWRMQGGMRPVLVRERLPLAAFNSAGEDRTSDHLARLWAREAVSRLAAQDRITEAKTLAVRYQLVTPVSGAVVLESQGQYDEAGLEPVEKGSVPTIPEPETWLLILVAGLLLIATTIRKKAHVMSSPMIREIRKWSS